MKVNILGVDYTITVKKYNEDDAFERRHIDGYCDSYTKEIVICDMATYKGWEHEPLNTILEAQRYTLRHEIVHAFLYESGLDGSSAQFEIGWARDEEMIDWFAIQGAKIYEVWKEAGALYGSTIDAYEVCTVCEVNDND